MSETAPTIFQTWMMAIRPKTLPAAAAPVIVGSAMALADNGFKFWPMIACLSAALLLQIGSNLANDVFDYEKGSDQGDRLGPTRVTQAGFLTPGQVKRGMLVVFGLSALIGLYLILVGGWPILILGVTAILSAIAYTGGPFPLGYNGLGDLFVFVFFGLCAVAGTYYVQVGVVTSSVLWMGVAMGFLTVNILVVNNLRDLENDLKAGKKTLAVRLGARGTKLEYVLCLCGAYLIPLFLWLAELTSIWVFLVYFTLPMAWPLIRSVYTETGRVLNRTLAGSGRLTLVYAVSYSAGLIIDFVL